MERIISKIKRTRYNWWEAFKEGIKLRGYYYYKMPPELKWRYPSPGSVPLTKDDRRNLYRHDWKTPFKESIYNIRVKEQGPYWNDPEVTKMFASDKLTPLDPNKEQHRNIMMGPTIDRRLKMPEQENFDVINDPLKTREEVGQEMREVHLAQAEEKDHRSEYQCTGNDYNYDMTYHPTYLKFHPRGCNPVRNAKHIENMYLGYEYYIEEVFGKERIVNKKMDMYKGQVKKWQVLDDAGFDRDQVEKIQKAIKAPHPEELEHYLEESKKPMTLPINNENVYAWRDKKAPHDSADFNPRLLDSEKKSNQSFFMKRYEKPKEISQ